ncbi:hypothetical protein SMGD1_0676 [Sulfurimonas gotlandica GD1]|uniref:Uncharacterized protein n=1 Tax=Sulfurimonas gotlandica (strain DSM 19862 / JCM 16533 / GD1) TaxID=929558 RepID=B6BKY9_SULGG|nr:hypothetical protein [Sulfurimonas gotlandica]EDZ62307.1 hypothetical protein CBGD1_222 [Sulfurimonas gotlandica GD1]EHP29203.1 hypothetical protein SMGD1_0676 [Sulfurimonas gotlandica GD1]
MTSLIYHNKKTGSYIEFDIDGKYTSSFFSSETDIKNAANNFVEYVMPKILQFGASIEFPAKLLQEFKDEREIDLFLMAAFNDKAKEALSSCIFALVPDNNMRNYLDIKTNEYHTSEAIGKNSMIICRELYDGKYSADNITFEELESRFITV